MTVELEQETDGRWLAEYKGIPGMMVYGATIGEALRKLADLIECPCTDGETPETSAERQKIADMLGLPLNQIHKLE